MDFATGNFVYLHSNTRNINKIYKIIKVAKNPQNPRAFVTLQLVLHKYQNEAQFIEVENHTSEIIKKAQRNISIFNFDDMHFYTHNNVTILV